MSKRDNPPIAYFNYFYSKKMNNYKLQKHWYLGFIGLIGFYKLSTVINYFQGNGSIWELINLLWFLSFLYFIPEDKK